MVYLFVDQFRILMSVPKQQFSFIISLVVAYLFALIGTGIFAFVGFAYPTSKLIGSKYYELKNVKRLRFIHSVLGVKYFNKALLLTFWGTKKNRKKYFDGTKSGIKNFIYQTHQSEFGHLAAFILLLICGIILLVVKEYYLLSLLLLLINIIGNFYPIILQRYHRIRIQKIAAHLYSE